MFIRDMFFIQTVCILKLPTSKLQYIDTVSLVRQGSPCSWNVFGEPSKAPDTDFIVELIGKIGTEIPEADMENVNIVGTSNGAALTYLLTLSTASDRPFRR